MDLQLNGKVALVTGGSGGLGRAICLGLAAEGANAAVHYRRDAELADAVVAELQQLHGVEAMSVHGDVSREDDVLEMFRRVEDRFSRLDILVNNAGVWPTASVLEMTVADWEQTFAVNLKGPFLCCREATRRWLASQRGGRIVNISSQAAFQGATTGHAHYAASKAGLVNFTVSLAREMAPHGIHANAVAAGMMRTDMTRETLQVNEDKYLDRIPLRRIGDPAEVADIVVFLASARASYMTGATVDVTGGMLMR
ncbi:MAG: SDR family NAD(P)-dependent oxidoreductase [Pirellulales bacterium]